MLFYIRTIRDREPRTATLTFTQLLSSGRGRGRGGRGDTASKSVNMVLNVHRGTGKREVRGVHCHHQNDFYIKMGSDESHFNVLLIVRDKVTRHCPQTTTFEEKGEPKRIQTEVPLLTNLTPYR